MSAIVDRKTIITTSKGDTFQVEASDKLENITHAKVTCDGPKCPTRHNSEVPVNFEFCQEDVAKDLDAYPEVGDYFLSVVIPPRSPSFKDGAPLAFCGRECLRDFFQYEYIAPPPRPVRKADKPEWGGFDQPKANVQKIVVEDSQPKMVLDENLSQLCDDLATQLNSIPTLPSSEDLDRASQSIEIIPGVTAAVSDATGYAEGE